jgi:hypothetical protein
MADVASEVTIGVLRPLEVRVGSDEPVEVVGPRLRTLMIRLALDPDRVMLASQLIDAVWDEDPPAEATNALQSLVSRLRRLRDDVVAADGGVASSGCSRVARRTAVVLPAPLGPRTASTVPVGAARSAPARALVSPKRLTRPSAWIASVMSAPVVGCLWDRTIVDPGAEPAVTPR